MSDQFDEWDKFYAAYEQTITVNGAMLRYKAKRKKAEKAEREKRRAAARTRNKAVAKPG